MLDKRLIKCDQKCFNCNFDCEIREENLSGLFEDISKELQLFTSNNVIKSLIPNIHLLKDDEGSQMIFIAECIEPHVRFLLQKAKIDKIKKDLIASNLNGFLYHIANQVISKNKKISKKSRREYEHSSSGIC